MDLSELGVDGEDIYQLTQIEQSAPAIALLKIAKSIYDRETRKLVTGKIGVSDDEPRKDFRNAIGLADCARIILEAPQEAKRQVKTRSEDE